MEFFKSAPFSSRVESSLGYVVFAEEHIRYQDEEGVIKIPAFVNHDWPIGVELMVEVPNPETGERIPPVIWTNVRKALMWLGWTVSLNRLDGTVEEKFPSSRMRGELAKLRWSQL